MQIKDSINQNEIIYNEPPVISQSDLPSDLNFLSGNEIGLSIALFIFVLSIFIVISYQLNKKSIDQDKYFVLAVILLILAASLFILIAGFSSERTVPIIGLLGTIVGYVLGNNNKK